ADSGQRRGHREVVTVDVGDDLRLSRFDQETCSLREQVVGVALAPLLGHNANETDGSPPLPEDNGHHQADECAVGVIAEPPESGRIAALPILVGDLVERLLGGAPLAEEADVLPDAPVERTLVYVPDGRDERLAPDFAEGAEGKAGWHRGEGSPRIVDVVNALL